MAPEFYDAVVAPTLGSQRGIVYVLPDSPGPELVMLNNVNKTSDALMPQG